MPQPFSRALVDSRVVSLAPGGPLAGELGSELGQAAGSPLLLVAAALLVGGQHRGRDDVLAETQDQYVRQSGLGL